MWRDNKEVNVSWLEAGTKLRELRKQKGLSIYKVGRVLNITGKYLSEIERGLKAPSDVVLHAIAEYYNLDRIDLFAQYNKIPPQEKEFLLSHKPLRKTLTHISLDKNLSDEEKEILAEEFLQVYEQFVKKKSTEG